MPSLLIIDDEESVRYSFRYVFEEGNFQVFSAGTAAEGLEMVKQHSPDVVVLDLQLPDRSGMDVFRDLQALDQKRPVIFITAHGTTETALAAMKQGAFDYLVKPVDLERLSQILNRAFEASRLMRVPTLLPVEEAADRILGRSPVMQEMCKTIGRVASQDVNVLILGDSGTGKELVARALYHHSKRADKPFLAINCAAIPEALLESELFGHEEGAFTGAVRKRIGKFEQCDQGTLFLDEIGDMALSLQAKMLRVLQEQRFERLGSNVTLQTRVRVIAATNQDLEKLVNQGRFRKDLYYRLKGVTIRVPTLQERREDVPELAHYFLFRFGRDLNKDVRAFAPEALELLQNYAWPGNVRELEAVVRTALLHTAGHVVFPEFLPAELRGQSEATMPPTDNNLAALVQSLLYSGEKDLYARAIAKLERVLIPNVLRHTQGNQTQASEMLGLSRNTLRQKMKSLGFAIDKVFSESPAADDNLS